MSGITIDELIAEMRRCEQSDSDGMTTREIVKATGFSFATVRTMLRDGIEAGAVKAATVRRPNPMRPGWQNCIYNVYRVVEKGQTNGSQDRSEESQRQAGGTDSTTSEQEVPSQEA